MVKIIGAGLAGCEAAYYLANKNIKVKLYEMKTIKKSPAHKTDFFAELVCSNSLRSNDIYNAVGLLKEEMRIIGSLILEAAEATQVPAGSSLAVDRELFSKYITNKIKQHPNIEVINQEVTQLEENNLTIIAAGPLASDSLSDEITKKIGSSNLYFFDAVAPIIDVNSINMNIAYVKDRYDKGDGSYINCPMSKLEYINFYNELIKAKKIVPKDFENNVFEGCMPIEVMASRGFDTLTYGPLKPVGLEHNGNKPFAVVQLRQDDAAKTMYNMVGFQTHMTFDEQKRIIRLIPGLEKSEIIRYGVMHKNTYINAPQILNSSYQVIEKPKIFFAGQISGVEGYVESAASGLVCAVNVYHIIKNNKLMPFPVDTMLGAMARYISTPNKSFVPMNANFSLLPSLDLNYKSKIDKRKAFTQRALSSIINFKDLL